MRVKKVLYRDLPYKHNQLLTIIIKLINTEKNYIIFNVKESTLHKVSTPYLDGKKLYVGEVLRVRYERSISKSGVEQAKFIYIPVEITENLDELVMESNYDNHK